MRQVKTNRAMILTAAAMTACAGMGVSSAMGQNRPWQDTNVTWSGNGSTAGWNDAGNWTAVSNVALQEEDINGNLVYTNPPTNSNPSWSATDFTTVSVPGNTLGIDQTRNASTNNNTYDSVTFGTGSNVTVTPDTNRKIGGITFANGAGNYVIGPANSTSTLYVTGNITGNSANTITFNSPIWTFSDRSITAVAGETINFNGAYASQNGLTLSLGGTGSINFNGGFNSTTGSGRAAVNVGSATMTISASTTATHRVGLSIGGTGTVNLNATHIIYGDPSGGGSMNDQQSSLKTGGAGQLNVNAADAVYGTASLWAGNTASGTTSVTTIKADQSYTGRMSTGNHAGVGTFGTMVGNITNITDERSTPHIGQDGFTVDTAATAFATLLVNNNASNVGGSHTDGGSATGNSDVNILTGLLGGNGYIVNTDVTINSVNYAQGVTLHKRQRVDNLNDLNPVGAATYGKLSPGASAGAAGTLTMDLGSKGLNIAYAVSDDNTQSLLFDLINPNGSDKVNLLNNTTLYIGNGGLEWNDFAFTTTGSIPGGTYTLFASANNPINGTLGTNVSGDLDGNNFHLAIVNGGKDLVLTSVPEPASLGLLAIGGLGLLARRRRMV